MKIYIEQDDVKLSFERAQELDYQTLFKAYQLITGSDEILEDLSQKEPENAGAVLKIDAEKLAEIDPVNIKAAKDKLSAKFSGSTAISQKPSEKVDVDLQVLFLYPNRMESRTVFFLPKKLARHGVKLFNIFQILVVVTR
ncbi:TPA: hypothetical protein ACKCKH_000810 [Streptococcus pneumoniae]|nr:hypothetical protein [Streptococcus pneumoniae]HEX0728088.1 hypothetical protein [Streptococcus pneumoniae]